MARQRKNKEDAWMPPRVYRGKSAYEYRPQGGPCVKLCKLHRIDGQVIEPPEVKRAVLEAYEAAARVSVTKDIDYWLTRFMASTRFQELSELTQSDYQRYIEIKVKDSDKTSRNGIRKVFGRMSPPKVEPHHIRRYMDYWAAVGKKTTANRHLSCLQTFFAWLREQKSGLQINPAKEIKKFKEGERKHYITDEEYTALLKAALESNTPYVAAFIEIAYLCGLRLHEVLQINMDDITDKGLIVHRGKGSKGETTEWSRRLRAAVEHAVSLHKPPEPMTNRPLLRNTRGQRVTRSAIEQAFRDVRADAGLSHVWIHDLKKKAVTEGKDAGHKTQRMRDLYDLKPAVRPPTR